MPALLLFFAFFIYIYFEISLLISVGANIGAFPLIIVMLAISALGLWIIKVRGIFTLWQIKRQVSEGQIPTQAFVSSVFLVIAGILLIIPGFLSDIFAIFLMLPFTRQFAERWLIHFFNSKVLFSSVRPSSYQASQPNTTFEAEFERKQDENKWIK